MSKKPAKKETTATPNRDAANDINDVLKPDPLLDVEADEAAIKTELDELLPSIKEGDDLTPATWKTLKAMGWKNTTEKIKTSTAAGTKAGAKSSAVKSPKAKAVASVKKTTLSRKDAVYAVIDEKGGTKKGVNSKELEISSTERMVKANGTAGTSASNICNNVLDALVQYKIMSRDEDGQCRFA